MKHTTLLILVFILSACGSTPKQQSYKNNSTLNSQKINQVTKAEETVSYQDIISKINEINIRKSGNSRVKEIVKEYTYNASDDDSKNSAKQKALTQVKLEILEEIGVYVESYLELNTLVGTNEYKNTFKREIKNLTAGIIKTKVIDESYDGTTYYVKASVLVDPDSVSEGISEVLKIRANKEKIDELSVLLKSKEKEIDLRNDQTIRLQKSIAAQELINNAKQQELKEYKQKLVEAELKLKQYEAQERQTKSKLAQIMSRITSQSNQAQQFVERGMTMQDVRSLVGEPASKYYNDYWIYGRVLVVFSNNIVQCLLKDSVMYKSCEADGYTAKYQSWAIIK